MQPHGDAIRLGDTWICLQSVVGWQSANGHPDKVKTLLLNGGSTAYGPLRVHVCGSAANQKSVHDRLTQAFSVHETTATGVKWNEPRDLDDCP